jgi:hypothetical protein
VIAEARQAMQRTIAAMLPDDPRTARRLLTVAMVGQFADFIAGSMGRRDIILRSRRQHR